MSLRSSKSTTALASYAQLEPKSAVGVNKRMILLVGLILISIVSYFAVANQHHNNQVQQPYSSSIQSFNHSNRGFILNLWSSDFHISPIADIKHLLADYEVKIIDKSLSGHCHLTNTCERDLRIITKLNGIHLRPCANTLRRNFYDSYKNDPVMLSVDAFICTHAASLCEIFMPFQKPMIVIASTR